MPGILSCTGRLTGGLCIRLSMAFKRHKWRYPDGLKAVLPMEAQEGRWTVLLRAPADTRYGNRTLASHVP